MVRVSVIVVNWNTRRLLERCLASVYGWATASSELEVLVVDNGSTDGSREMVASRYPRARLITNTENVGFARANNMALRQAVGDYLLLLNPDTELVGAAIPELLQWAEEHAEVAVVGPQLLNPDGSVQSSRRRFPTIATAFLESTVLQRWLPDHPVLQEYYVLDRSNSDAQEVDWLVGACLLVRGSAVRQVGLLDEGFFMYSEEMDWCRRFTQMGWKVAYCPAARVVHYGGQGSDQDLFRRHTRFQHSKARYFEKYHGRGFAQLLRLFLLGNYLFLLAEDTLKLLLPRKRGMRLRRIAVLGRVVTWQVRWVVTWGRVRP